MKRIVDQGGDPKRRAALELNQTLRARDWNGALPDQSGHVAFQIPELDFWFHVKLPGGLNPNGYDLLNPDVDIARAELRRLLTDHPEYRTNKHEGRRGTPFKRGVVVR